MPLQAQTARELFDSYDKYKIQEIRSRRFTQADMLRWLKPLENKGVFQKTEIGKSAEGRMISMFTVGSGSTKVLLWSQMHGDEPTATMALLDMLNFFALSSSHPFVMSIREELMLLIIPMVNPDGAEIFQRRTAQCVDMNRDALRLETPEARMLKEVQQTHKPDFGFNLHDQDPLNTVGASKKVTAVALLAPATDESRADNAVRSRAKKVAATVANVLTQFINGHLAKYDDTFEPRAFGDNIQRWGTSTILIESGGWPQDRDKMFLRKMNYVALLSSLGTIADKSYETADLSLYEQLPFNTKNLYDIIIRNGRLKVSESVPVLNVDVGLNLEEVRDSSTGKILLTAKIVDVGDLSTYAALEEINAAGSSLDERFIHLEMSISYEDIRTLIRRK
ncbi:MAG TPA: M14 family zinc carboxypeptidase [Bacteroidota bacterium]|nr:M14 family zinc carboxypeptidase [Bacteroidota bacterium]